MLNRFLNKSEFAKNSFILVAGTVIAQLIPLLLHPFLRRIYSPSDFGAMSVYLNIFVMLTIIVSLRYEAAIVLPKNENVAVNVLALSCSIAFGFSLFFFAFFIFFKDWFVALINFPKQYANYLYFLPLTTFLFGVFQNMNYWLIRQKAFRSSTINKITRRAFEGVVQFTLGIIHFPAGLILGDLTGNLANTISGFRQIRRNKFSLENISIKKIKFVSVKYSEFPKYNVLPTLFSTAATMLPFIFINKLFSSETVGYLDLSRLVLSIPLAFISATISQVFFQRITEKKNNSQSIKNDVLNISYFLLAFIGVEVILILLFAPFLFGLVFGGNYRLSGEFSQILIYSYSLNFICSTFSAIFITFGKIRLNSVWQTVYLLAICSLLFFRNLDIATFLKVYVTIEVVMYSINVLMLFLIVRGYEREISKK